MKKIIVTVLILFAIVSIYATWHRQTIAGKSVDVSCDPMTWIRMGADINALDTFDENVDFWFEVGQEYPEIGISRECADLLKQKFLQGQKTKVLVPAGVKYDFEIYSGVLHVQKARIAQITTGPNFDQFYASAWSVEADDPVFGNHVVCNWFANELNGKKQCNNFCGIVKPIIKPEPKIEPRVEIKYVPEPYPVYETIHDTVTVYDTVFVETVSRKLCAHVWGWTSGSTDLFGNPFFKIHGSQGYVLNSYTSNDHGIYSGIGSLGGKICLQDKFAAIGTLEGGYQDGPIDWQSYAGIQYQAFRKNFFEVGWRHDYREFSHLQYQHLDLVDGGLLERYSMRYIAVKEENAIYGGYESLSRGGTNHFQMYGSKCLNKNSGTASVRGSVKLEPRNWYIFAGGGYQQTPSELVDTLRAPAFDHYSFDVRVGRSVTKNWLLFISHREIYHNQNQDDQNDWSRYKRSDFRLGAFYRPFSILGIRNLYAEAIVGYSKIQQELQNSMDREDDLLELKLSLFWNISSKYLH